jgi:hypothetical protein
LKKVLNVVLSSALLFGVVAPTVGAESVYQEQKVNQEQKVKKFKKQKIGNNVHSTIDGVEVELIGVDSESFNDEFADETLSLLEEHMKKEKEKKAQGDISIMQDEIGGSGGRVAGVYPNDFEHNVWGWIDPLIRGAVESAITLGSYVYLGSDAKTTTATAVFSGAVADAISSTLTPEYTNTFYLYDYSTYYGKTIYKQVTYIYKESSRITLKSIKVSSPLEKVVVNGSTFFRAL